MISTVALIIYFAGIGLLLYEAFRGSFTRPTP
jgi:hypothetical protein